jgi:hypothetical protein
MTPSWPISRVGPPFSAVTPPGFVPVKGTVSDARAAGFTVVTSGGTRVPVTTSGGTLVIVPHASLGQLRAGARSPGAIAAALVSGG